MNQTEQFTLGETVLYQGAEAEVCQIVDPITIKVRCKEYFEEKKVPHSNWLKRLFGFKTTISSMAIYRIDTVSIWSIKKINNEH